jgi:hypothetical protein
MQPIELPLCEAIFDRTRYGPRQKPADPRVDWLRQAGGIVRLSPHFHLEIVASEYTAHQAEFEAVEGRRRVLGPLK